MYAEPLEKPLANIWHFSVTPTSQSEEFMFWPGVPKKQHHTSFPLSTSKTPSMITNGSLAALAGSKGRQTPPSSHPLPLLKHHYSQ